MSIAVTKYKLTCDVDGCNKVLEGTPSQIASSGWGAKLWYQGIGSFYQFTASEDIYGLKMMPTVCSSCKAQGFDKTLKKE